MSMTVSSCKALYPTLWEIGITCSLQLLLSEMYHSEEALVKGLYEDLVDLYMDQIDLSKLMEFLTVSLEFEDIFLSRL